MAWTAEKVKAMRESNPSKAAESSGWTAEKVRAVRTKTPNPSTASSTVLPKSNIYADALQQYTERHISDMGEVDARNEPSQARSGRKENLSPFPSADAARERSSPVRGAILKGSPTERALDMGQKWGVPAKSGNVLENVGSGAMAYGTGRAQELRASFAKDSVPDEFDRINQWMDTGDNKNLADAVRRVDNTHGAYTDADLIQKGGWTQAQIDEARKMNAALDAIPAWKRGVRRAANTIGGIADTVAAAPVLGAEYGVQAGKNIDATLKNWKQVEQEVKGDEHAQSLFDLLTNVDMDYNPTWPESRNRERISMGYNSKEIREMRQKLAGLEVSDGIDKNQSVGYQLYDRGQQLTAAAQSGLSPTQRAVAGAVTSAAENLAVAGVNPAAVLPVLSAQGAAEAMGQSAEKGESAGKALGGGLAKFGAGWAINSVGAADLAKTMGSDYAKDTLAGQIADWVQGLAGSSELAKRYPAVAAAISGGIDNSMQAFAETYADMAIDAALGDSEAAKNLFSKDTFLTALESGLSGGASGALGGAVGTGLAKLNGGDASLLGQTEHYDQMDRMKRAAAQQKEWEARAAEPSQPTSPAATENISGQEENLSPFPSADAARERSSTESMQRADAPQAQTEGVNSSVNEAAAQSENPAVRQFAEVAASDSLTGKTIGLFTPNAENRENCAAFEQAYGVTLPDTAGATRRMLRDIAAQQNVKSEAAPAVQSAELPSEAASVPQTVQDAPAETADAMPETAAPDNVREATAAVGETDSYENAPLRETLGLRPEAPKTQREAEVQRALEGWRVTDKAAETISKNMPDRVDADRYAAAASPLYRLGRSGADTFAQALELAGSMSGTAADINYILSTDAGRTALEIAYTQGKGERMLYAEKMTELGGALGSESTSGRGEVYAKGTMRQESDVASQIISLNAAATGTDAILYNVLQNDRSIRAYVDTETARIFFGDSAQDIFGTVLHEDYHWYNALDAEGARTLQEHALEYLAKSSGYESLDEMIRAKLRDYSAQSLTYEQAAEELVADAWRGIFDSEESFKRWVTFQRGQAEKNAGKSGAIHKVMEQVRQMLDGLISRAKEVLTIDPDDRAALKAKRLAEAEKRTLQDEYFAHAEKAMDNLRSAKENAAALKNESAAEGRGVRYSINPSYAQDIDEWNRDGRNSREIFVLGSTAEALQGLGARENDIYMKGDKISLILEQHPEMTLNEIKRIPEILDDPILVLSSRNKGRAGSQNTRLVLFGSVKAQDGRPVLCVLDLQPVENRIVIQDMQKATSAYTKDNDPVRFVRSSEVLYTSENKKRTTALLRTLGFQMPSELQRYGSMGSISYHGQNVKMEGVPFTEIEASSGTHVESEDSRSRLPKGSIYQESSLTTVLKTEQGDEAPKLLSKNSIAQENAESKGNSVPVKKTVRFQLSESRRNQSELQKESRELERQRRALKEERANWQESNEVRAIEEKKKAYGLFSEKGKAFRASEEYQSYLEKRKEFNRRGAELESRIGEVNDKLRQAQAEVENARQAVKQEQQKVYDTKAKAAGGKPEYRRKLAVKQFGTTDRFERAGYILPDGRMLNFAQNDGTRDTDHREILDVFGPAEVPNGTEALNKFLADGNVRVMAEAPGVDIAAKTPPTEQQLRQIRAMVEQLGSEKRRFTIDISTTDGRVAASKEYSGKVDADKVVREIREYYKTGELPAESELARFRYQRAEQADRDAKQNQQRQASRVLAEKAAAFDTLNQFFGLTKNTRLSDAALESLAIRWTKTNGSRADRTKLANETRALVDYLRSEGADMAKAQGLAETLAGEVLDEATYRNTELWNQYPDLHDLTYTVDKNGKAKAELVKRYGSWTEAVAEARRHGVKLRQAEGYRDGNPAEQYEAIVNDTRAVGGVKESAAALFRSAAQEAGVAGAASMESTEWLDVLMNVHDTIKPRMMSRFADVAEYEDAKVELAGRMIGDIMSHPEMTDAEAVFEGILKHNREVAAMAAGSEERAAEVTKGLKSVQQTQRKAFADRMRENSRSQSAEVKSVSRAERQLNENLETLGAQVSTAAGLDEKMTALREAYEREWKAEKNRMKQARQEMLDEIKLERRQLRSQINDLSRQVAGEQRRADRAEHQLLVQENEIMEWEAENQRKAEAWQEKQAQRNAIAIETARQQRDEDVAVAKALAEKRVQKAREGRKADELKRSIRNNAAQLNQMVLRPKPGKYVQKSLIVQAAEVAKLADMAVLNETAVKSLTRLENAISKTMGTKENPSSIAYDWEKTGVPNMIAALRTSLMDSKDEKIARLKQQLEETAALPDSDKSEQLRDRLRQRIRETENRTYLPMTVDQLRMLKAITASTLHMIRTENKTLSLARAEEVDGMAMKAAREVLNSEGNGFGEKFEKAKGAMNRYQLDMLGGTRMFRRLGGYTKNGQMEKLGQMLNDGQRRQTEILVEGESLFANVTGKEHLKEVEAFAGPGAELVDIGLKDSRGDSVPLNHAQLCSLYMLLRNEDSRHHLMTGGLTLPDAAQYAKGNIERAYQRSQTVMLGTLVNADGTPMADTILQTVQDAMTDYDRNWCKDMEDFFGRYTTNLINETSMKLLGYDRATVKNYYPIAVDRSTLATEIEGVKMDATIEGRGFLKERVKSDKPILLEECQNVVKRSLRDTAAYAGLAAPIRDVQRVLNSTVETAEGIGVLKDKIIGEKWGRETVSYINDLLTDLQTRQRHRSSTMSRALDRMRGNYAGAILTVNPGVAIAQAASLPTAGAVLGADTMAAVLPFAKNFSGKQRAALEAEIRQHGDALLQYRLRGTKRGEMSSIGAHKNLVAKASEAMPAVTGWITGMDEITVAALWEGSKRYVERHAAEFGEGAAEKGSEAYWEAVNKMYQRVIEETQPNYTTMQRAGIQRSDNEFVKTLTMFTTQRFQNYGILADAVGDYKAQKARYAADQSAENKAEVQRAGQSLRRAAASQVVQTAVFALMKIGADFLLHRWDKEQDENGDITAASVGKRFFDLYTESAAGNFLYGAEIYSVISNAASGADYDVVSATNISAVNDLSAAFTKTVKLLRTDTSEMSEEELAVHNQKLNKAVLKDIQCGLELYGVPAANIRKVMQAFEGYWEDAQAIGRGEGFSFNSAPSSATGQYDRLYNAIQSGDSEEAAAAMKKLEQMGKTDKVDGELARRLKQYDADVLAAAEARNAGKTRAEEKARKAVFEKLREGLDVAPVTDRAKGKADAARRAQLIDLVNKAVDGKADELLAGGKDGSIYDALLDEVKNGRVEDAQEELDRLMTAGKDKGSIKSKITEAVKEEYLAGSDRDREKLEKKLLALEDADENPLYEEKNFAQWVSAADKKAEKAKDEKNWWEGVK